MLHDFDKGKAREIALNSLNLEKKLEAIKKWFHRVSVLEQDKLKGCLNSALDSMTRNMDENETKEFLRRHQFSNL